MSIELRKAIRVFFLCFGVYQLGVTENCPQYGEYNIANTKAHGESVRFVSVESEYIIAAWIEAIIEYE